MKTLIKIFIYSILSLAVTACSGVEDEIGLLLSADKTAVQADGTDAVTFSVRYGDTDVTSDSEIICSEDGRLVENGKFTTETVGKYSFRAVYLDVESEPVAVSAEKPVVTVSKYRRNICVMEFTGQWCGFCPKGMRTLNYYLQKPRFKDCTYVIALHDDSSGDDDFALPVQREIYSYYGLTVYPSALIDNRDRIALSADGAGNVVSAALDAALYEHLPHCGVAVSSAYDEVSGKAVITAKVASEKDARYRLAVWIIEDGLVGKQNDNGVYGDYVHNHVARALVSSTYKGDSLGEIAADDESVKTYEIAADAVWNLENTSVYALAIDNDGFVDNMAACAFVNGNTDYATAQAE